MPHYHPYSEVTSSGRRLEPKTKLKNLGGLSRIDKMLAMASEGYSYTQIARALKIGRGAVSGAIHRHKVANGHKPIPRDSYTRNKLPETFSCHGYDKEVLDHHSEMTKAEHAARDKLRSFLR